MAKDYEEELVEVKWSDPTEEETPKAVMKANGSGGVDGWVGEEVWYLPAEVSNIFRKQAIRWQETQKVLETMKETRQANLTKPGKVNNGTLEAGDTQDQ